MKLTDGLPPSQMGMLGLSAMPKTPPKPVPSRNMPDYGLSLDSRAGVGLRRGCGSAGSSTVSSSASAPGGRGCTTGRSSSSGTPSSRSTVARRVSTPAPRPQLNLGGLLGTNSFHTEYREQMSPSWWLGAAACSSSWLQLSPPPEVMELVEKKKLTEQFKTVEGLIDRADYLGALRLQADRRNVLHFLALDEQEMQAYLWQPRFPRIVDLRNRTGEAHARPPPRHANCIVNPMNLWLKFLTLSPPLYSTQAPLPAVSPKTPQTGEGMGGDHGFSLFQRPELPYEYCFGTSGEQFLPILFEDSGGVAECVPPDELLMFEEDALREVASHIESKLAHALSCMVLSATARTRAAALTRKVPQEATPINATSSTSTASLGSPQEAPPTEEKQRRTGSPTAPGDRRSGSKRRRSSVAARNGSLASSPVKQARSSPAHKAHGATAVTEDVVEGSPLPVAFGSKGPAEVTRADVPAAAQTATENDIVTIELEDLFTTYGACPSLLKHQNCFQQARDA
ncbi:hypothetical protein, conserved [Eimeria necatrix]|uniref:Uncharacterized protein n=1 Tax=Eimeria necatrix TaxID=51315 RepID=U6MR23_9EIME|nr:hypothetical protein, conserved [Eimeria necatrix]CDJ64085.1 hypothetical protein, conserved [Eimeria necatrix]